MTLRFATMAISMSLSWMLLLSCGSSSNNSPPPQTDPTALTPPGTTRDWLTADILLNGSDPHHSPIHNDYFMPVGSYGDALHKFSGAIRLNTRQLNGTFAANYIAGDESVKNFPAFDLQFVSDAGNLIPVNRDRQLRTDDNSFWGIILEPGRVWSEADDNGWSRASFPFELISYRRNNVQNGIATFLYNESQISDIRVQVVQETTSWFRFDIRGQLEASYIPQNFVNESQLITAFNDEVNLALPLHPWNELASINTNLFNSYLTNSNISGTGMVIDGELYAQPCYTRYGNYPYCRWMRHGVYSVTKSLGASLTMMRLAEKYGPEIYDLEISDYLTVTATHNGWSGVTFADALNMATGVGDNGTTRNSGDIFADENKSKMDSWLVKPTLQQKLDIAFTYGNYSWGPGEEFRYNSVMTFVLAAALDSYYKSIEGANADLWDMMITEVFNPIGIQHVPVLKTTEVVEANNIPELFHGLYLNQDDVAKLTTLLQNDGMHQGTQILHAAKLQESLYKTSNMGLHSWWEDNQYGQSRYLHSFWSSPYASGSCSEQIPYMSGFGGNIVAVLPNGVSLYRFADADSYSPFNMITASVAVRGVCD